MIIYGYRTLECIIGVSTSCFESSQSFLMDCMFQSLSVPDTQFTSDWVQLQRFIQSNSSSRDTLYFVHVFEDLRLCD